MKHLFASVLIFVVGTLLRGCLTDPTPLPTSDNQDLEVWATEQAYETVSIADPTEAPSDDCNSYGMQQWIRYPVIDKGQSQKIGIAADYCEHPLKNQLVTICVANVCHDAVETNEYGQVEIDGIEAVWDIGSVPVTACLNDLTEYKCTNGICQDVPVCIQWSFTVVQP